MKKLNTLKKYGVAIAATGLALASSQAQVTDAAGLVDVFDAAIANNDTVMWTLGASVASFIAIVLVIGMIIRGGKRVAGAG